MPWSIKVWFKHQIISYKRPSIGGPFLFLHMFRIFLLLGISFFVQSRSSAQYHLGLGASIHRYDQVVSLKGLKNLEKGSLGVDLGLGVERSLQGALAPQIALFWQASIPLKNRHYPMNQPFYTVRYQFDFQKASFIDTYHGLYFGLGYAFGVQKRVDLQFSLGVLAEKIYGLSNVSTQDFHILLNPQFQVNYYLFSRKKWSSFHSWQSKILSGWHFLFGASFFPAISKSLIQQ